jgi:hypothetical protein
MTPASLHPGPALAERCIDGDREARAILNSWAFHFPVRSLPATHPWWSLITTFCGGTL